MRIRQRLDHPSVDVAEDRSVCADSQSQREDNRERKARTSPQLPRSVANVLSNLLQPGPAPGIAGFFLEECRVAEGAHGGVAGFFAAHAASDVLGDLLVKMKLN